MEIINNFLKFTEFEENNMSMSTKLDFLIRIRENSEKLAQMSKHKKYFEFRGNKLTEVIQLLEADFEKEKLLLKDIDIQIRRSNIDVGWGNINKRRFFNKKLIQRNKQEIMDDIDLN